MVVEIKQQVCDGRLLKWLMAAGLAWLEHNVEQVNQMNVFPVPDGDTGTNMLLTMRKAYHEIAPLDEAHVGIVSDAIARGALMGARGNSGVILSQILRGFAKRLQGLDVFDADVFAEACDSAVDFAYKAVIDPVEGTILTVTRETRDAVVDAAKNGIELRQVLDIAINAAHTSLKKTPDLLPILHEAGVVDSGGLGLTFILEGMRRMLEGEEVNIEGAKDRLGVNGQHWQEALVPEDEEGYGYDVQFLMRGTNMDVDDIRHKIDDMGWSTLVVGDENLIKVHVHVHDPGQPLSYAIGLGVDIDDVVVENMQLQYHGYVENRVARETNPQKQVDGVAVITVASGEGLSYLMQNDLNAAHVIFGGQTMNPSTEDFLSVIDSLPNDEIVLLPNNKNIIMAAEQAATLCHEKKVKVIPSRTILQGISALFAYTDARNEGDFDGVVEAMQEALSDIRSIEITTATRDVELDGIAVKEGQTIGLLDGKLSAASNDMTEVLIKLLQKAHAEDYELVTLYYGSEVSDADASALVEELQESFADLEFEVINGGQPLYPYIISLE